MGRDNQIQGLKHPSRFGPVTSEVWSTFER